MEENRKIVIPLTRIIDEKIFQNFGDILSFLESIVYDPDYSVITSSSEYLKFNVRLIITEKVEADFFIIPGSKIFLSSKPTDYPFYDIEIILNSSPSLEISNIQFGIQFNKDLIQAYVYDVQSGDSTDKSWKIDEREEGYIISISTGIYADLQGEFEIKAPTISGMKPFMIGKTGFILDLAETKVGNYINKKPKPSGQPFHLVTGEIPGEIVDKVPIDFKGIYLRQAFVYYHNPEKGTKIPPIGIQDAAIGEGGFTGNLVIGNPSKEVDLTVKKLDEWFKKDDGASENSFSFESDFAAKIRLQGFDAVLWSMRLSFYKSIPNAFSLVGVMRTGLSDKWITFKAAIAGPNGDIFLEIGGLPEEPLLNLETDWYKVVIDSIAYKMDNNIHYAIINGGIQVKFDFLDLPLLKVDRLSVGSDGSIDIEGGWAEFPETIPLDFHGFDIELKEIGMGTEGENELQRQWFGFSGGINLIQDMGGASVEGLKVSWNKARGDDIQVSLKGIKIDLKIEGTLSIKGEINYDEETNLFRGSVNIDFESLQFEIEGELIVGKTIDAQGREFDVFYIALSARMTPGITLGATGLSLIGIGGLYGMNVTPNKTEEQRWYDWYKSDPAYNIINANKWGPVYNNYAFGAGVTLATSYDAGYSLEADVMLAILIPGPVVIIEGGAELLKTLQPDEIEVPENDMADQIQTTSDKKEAKPVTKKQGSNFYLLAVFDGRAGTMQLNIDIKIVIQELVNIGGGLEAFFDFNDNSKWYIHIGVKDPESKRIQAEVLGVFDASTYMMISAKYFNFGAAVAWGFKGEYGPVMVAFRYAFTFDIGLVFNPFQAEARFTFLAELGIKVFIFNFGLFINAELDATFPKPYHIHGILKVAFGLPFPFPGFEFDIPFELKEEGLPKTPDHLLKGVSFTHHKSSGFSLPIEINRSDIPDWKKESFWDTIPFVPVDSRPVLHFEKEISNLYVLGIFNEKVDDAKPPQENLQFRYEVINTEQQKVLLESLDESTNQWQPEFLGFGKNKEVTNAVIENHEPLKFQINSDSFINGIDAKEPQLQLWQYRPLDMLGKYNSQTTPAKQSPCKILPASSYLLEEIVFSSKVIGQKLPVTFTYKDVTFSYDGGFEITKARNHSYLKKGLRIIPFLEKIDSGNFYITPLTIKFPNTVTLLIMESTFGGVSDAIKISLDGYLVSKNDYQTNFKEGSVVIKCDDGFDTVTLLFSTTQNHLWNTMQQGFGDTIIKLSYFLKKDIKENEDIPPIIQAGQQEVSEKAFLKPGKKYRLSIPTAIKTSTPGNEVLKTAVNKIYFKTNYGPGVPFKQNTNTSYETESVHQFKNYIKKTSPSNGAKNHYRNYDIVIQYNEQYVKSLFENPIVLKIRDQNDNSVINSDEGNWLNALKSMPQLHRETITQEISSMLPKQLAMESTVVDTVEDLCITTNVPKPIPTLAYALKKLRAMRRYFCNLEVKHPKTNEVVNLYDFEFISSNYHSFTHHLTGDFSKSSENQEVNFRDLKNIILKKVERPKFEVQLDGKPLWKRFENVILAFKEYQDESILFFEKKDLWSNGTTSVALEKITKKHKLYLKESNFLFKKLFENIQARFESLGIQEELPNRFEVLIAKIDSGNSTNSNTSFLLFQSPEPIEWERLQVQLKGEFLTRVEDTNIPVIDIEDLLPRTDFGIPNRDLQVDNISNQKKNKILNTLAFDISKAKILGKKEKVKELIQEAKALEFDIRTIYKAVKKHNFKETKIDTRITFLPNEDKTRAFLIFKNRTINEGDFGMLLTQGTFKLHFDFNGKRNPNLDTLFSRDEKGESIVIDEKVYFNLEI